MPTPDARIFDLLRHSGVIDNSLPFDSGFDSSLDSGEAIRITPLAGAGGFSGAEFWKCESDTFGRDAFFDDAPVAYCVRKWPAGVTKERVDWIHATIDSISVQLTNERAPRGENNEEKSDDGVTHAASWLATALPDPNGGTTFAGTTSVGNVGDNSIYEVTRWMPGQADYWQRPSRERLRNAMTALAKFHLAAERVHPATPHKSPGLVRRLERIVQLQNGQLERIQAAVQSDSREFVRQAAAVLIPQFRLVAPSLRDQLRSVVDNKLRLTVCLRDIWHDHVLFCGDEVSGIVDYDALRIESAVGDISRLINSLVGTNQADQEIGLEAYEATRPLHREERSLLSIWGDSSAVLAGLQWIEWLCVDGRRFENQSRVAERLQRYVNQSGGCVDRRLDTSLPSQPNPDDPSPDGTQNNEATNAEFE